MSKDSLQLPKTAFSMKASLPTKEPEILKNGIKKNSLINLEKDLKVKKNLFCTTDPHMQMAIYTWELL